MDASIFTATKKLAIDLSIIDGMCWQYVVLYDDWSDVYHVVEFEKESEPTPHDSQQHDNDDRGGFSFILCLVIAVVIYYCFLRF